MTQRFGCVAVVGVPNAGKSSLLNVWMGQKVSIVSPKPQTTRIPIGGVAIHDKSQILFLDAPGLFESERSVDRAMLRSAWKTLERAHVVCVVVDPTRQGKMQKNLIHKIVERCDRPKILVINKVDQVSREELLVCAATYTDQCDFSKIFMVSARTHDGVQDVLACLAQMMPQQPWVYPEDQISTLPQRFLAEEMTREQIFIQIDQEIPYGIHIHTERWEETCRGELKIYQVIYVPKDSQKAIILGHQGKRIQSIGSSARRQLMTLLQCPVHLFLHVKVNAQEARNLSVSERESPAIDFS